MHQKFDNGKIFSKKKPKKKQVNVKSYVKSNGTFVSSHNRNLTIHTPYKYRSSNISSNITKIDNVIDGSHAFGLHLNDNLKLLRKPKAIKIILPECSNDVKIAHSLGIQMMQDLFKN